MKRWEASAAHRTTVTRLLNGSIGGNGDLCLLGAGECNDVTLDTIDSRFESIALVDIDGTRIKKAADRVGHPARLETHVVDLFNIELLCRDPNSYRRNHLDQVTAVLNAARSRKFAVVASCCVLSQAIDELVKASPAVDDTLARRLALLREVHIELLMRLSAPGAVAWLLTDIVSDSTAPELRTLSRDALPGLLPQLVATHNHFHGLNPIGLQAAAAAAVRTGTFESVALLKPWVWDMGNRSYLVLAYRFQTRDSSGRRSERAPRT